MAPQNQPLTAAACPLDSDLEAPDSTFRTGWISSFESPLNFSSQPGNICSCGRHNLGR
jgi:hypothetical protein